MKQSLFPDVIMLGSLYFVARKLKEAHALKASNPSFDTMLLHVLITMSPRMFLNLHYNVTSF